MSSEVDVTITIAWKHKEVSMVTIDFTGDDDDFAMKFHRRNPAVISDTDPLNDYARGVKLILGYLNCLKDGEI